MIPYIIGALVILLIGIIIANVNIVPQARASDKDARYEKDEVLNVVAIEGVKLICKK